MEKATFIEYVIAEIKAIRKYATKQEKSRLSIEDLNPLNPNTCIYGLMTNNCRSARAVILIRKCCKRVFGNHAFMTSNLEKDNAQNITGASCEVIKEERLEYLSSLEHYICFDSAKNKEIIDYIKGNSEILTL